MHWVGACTSKNAVAVTHSTEVYIRYTFGIGSLMHMIAFESGRPCALASPPAINKPMPYAYDCNRSVARINRVRSFGLSTAYSGPSSVHRLLERL